MNCTEYLRDVKGISIQQVEDNLLNVIKLYMRYFNKVEVDILSAKYPDDEFDRFKIDGMRLIYRTVNIQFAIESFEYYVNVVFAYYIGVDNHLMIYFLDTLEKYRNYNNTKSLENVIPRNPTEARLRLHQLKLWYDGRNSTSESSESISLMSYIFTLLKGV